MPWTIRTKNVSGTTPTAINVVTTMIMTLLLQTCAVPVEAAKLYCRLAKTQTMSCLTRQVMDATGTLKKYISVVCTMMNTLKQTLCVALVVEDPPGSSLARQNN